MRLTKCENVGFRGIGRKCKFEALFEEFMKMNVKIAEASFDEKDEYKTLNSAYGSLHKAARRWSKPINVRMYNKKIYLVRTDMD